MLSQKTRYALKALTFLADDEKSGKGPVLISDLAKRGDMPQKFLEAILLELKNHGILQSKKGKGGGYFLGKDAEDIRLGTVIRLLEGPMALLPCVSQTAYRRCDECEDEETCGIRILFKEVRDATAQILDNTSLAKVKRVEEQVAGRQNKQLMYFI
jgi:Rrf2 family protein